MSWRNSPVTITIHQSPLAQLSSESQTHLPVINSSAGSHAAVSTSWSSPERRRRQQQLYQSLVYPWASWGGLTQHSAGGRIAVWHQQLMMVSAVTASELSFLLIQQQRGGRVITHYYQLASPGSPRHLRQPATHDRFISWHGGLVHKHGVGQPMYSNRLCILHSHSQYFTGHFPCKFGLASGPLGTCESAVCFGIEYRIESGVTSVDQTTVPAYLQATTRGLL